MSISTQVAPISASSQAPNYSDLAGGASRLTGNGIFTFLLGASLVASGFSAGRFDFGGLKVHPYLAVVAVIFLPLAAARLRFIPVRLVVALTAFGAVYFTSTIVGGVAVADGLKFTSSIVTILTMAMLVRNRQDFVVGALGMTLAIGSLAVRGLRTDMSGGLEAIENANRNSYSLYALPCVLMSGFVLLRPKSVDLWTRCLLVGGLLAVILGISLNLNRSGWLGLALIATLLIYERSFKAAAAFAVIGAVLGIAMSMFFNLSHVQDRWMATRQGLSSDELRWKLLWYSIEIGIENPLVGVSPQGLGHELAARLGAPGASIETHNIFAHIFGGCGVICLVLMFYCGFLMWNRRLPRLPPNRLVRFREARRLMRYMLILWLLRGFFSHEILYSPAFCMGLGLCVGLCLLPVLRLPAVKPRPGESRVEYRSADLLGET
jgi:hypothetical protein